MSRAVGNVRLLADGCAPRGAGRAGGGAAERDDGFCPPYTCRMLCWCARAAAPPRAARALAPRLLVAPPTAAPAPRPHALCRPAPRARRRASDAAAPPGGRRRAPFLLPPGAPGLPPTLDFTTGPDEAACLAAGLRPLRSAASLVVRYRGVGNNAVTAAFKAAGFRREPLLPPPPPLEAAAAAAGAAAACDAPAEAAPAAAEGAADATAAAAAAGAPPAAAPRSAPAPVWTAMWGGQLTAEEYAALLPGQKVNHFPCANELGRKDRLARALAAASARAGAAAFAFSPRTFCLPADGPAWAAEAASAARAAAAQAAAAAAAAAAAGEGEAAAADGADASTSAAAAAMAPPPRLYIVKPPALSRGRGVRVCPAEAVPRRRRLLVQRYIHPPHLLDGLKYDLRCAAARRPLNVLNVCS
jgi:hypothetical protein